MDIQKFMSPLMVKLFPQKEVTPPKPLTVQELCSRLGITTAEYRSILDSRWVVKEEVKPTNYTATSTVKEILPNSLDEMFSKVRATYNKAKSTNKHRFKSVDSSVHIINAKKLLDKDVVDTPSIIDAIKHLFYAYYVSKVGVKKNGHAQSDPE